MKKIILEKKEILVPSGIMRLVSRGHFGWQADAENGWKFYRADEARNRAGALLALAEVCDKLAQKLEDDPPSAIRMSPSPEKVSTLPVGITMVMRKRSGKPKELYFRVHTPRFEGKPRNVSVYISNENTYTITRKKETLKKAIAVRAAAIEAFQQAELAAKRKDRKARSVELRKYARKLRAEAKQVQAH